LAAPQRAPTTAVTVVASFVGDDTARAAADALVAAGFPPSAIASGEESRRDVRERHVIWRVFWVGFWWGVVGAVLGAAVGLGVGALFGGTVIQVVGWAMLLHVLGAIYGLYVELNRTGAHVLARQRGGRAVLSVACPDAGAVSRASAIVRERGGVVLHSADAGD
jgi:hypothetical protein